MVNDPENRDPELDAVEAKILRERDELLEKRARLMTMRAELLTELRQADRRLADCRATARFFGLNIEFPDHQSDEIDRLDQQRLERERAYRIAQRELEVRRAQIEEMRAREEKAQAELSSISVLQNTSKEPASTTPTAAGEGATKTIREVVIDRLTAAGESGAKAAVIREFYERSSGKPIHEKTVGMTLYRLQNDGIVRREGHVWFLVRPKAETGSPGAGAPGSIDS
jgi:ATPase subunit of ABC transporter with duplicated ATPase domains